MAKDLDRTTQPLVGYQTPSIVSTEEYKNAASNEAGRRNRLTSVISTITQDYLQTKDADYETKLKLQVLNKARELESKYPTDPEGIKKEAEIWEGAEKKNIPVKFHNTFNNYSANYIQGAYYNSQAKLLALQQKSLETNLITLYEDIENKKNIKYETEGLDAYMDHNDNFLFERNDINNKFKDNKIWFANENGVYGEETKKNQEWDIGTVAQLTSYTFVKNFENDFKELGLDAAIQNASKFIGEIADGKAPKKIKDLLKENYPNNPNLEQDLKGITNLNIEQNNSLASQLNTRLQSLKNSVQIVGNAKKESFLQKEKIKDLKRALDPKHSNDSGLWNFPLTDELLQDGNLSSETKSDIYDIQQGKQGVQYRNMQLLHAGELELNFMIEEHQELADHSFSNHVFQKSPYGLKMSKGINFNIEGNFSAWLQEGNFEQKALSISHYTENVLNGIVPTPVKNYILGLNNPIISQEDFRNKITLLAHIQNFGGQATKTHLTRLNEGNFITNQQIYINTLFPNGLQGKIDEDVLKSTYERVKQINSGNFPNIDQVRNDARNFIKNDYSGEEDNVFQNYRSAKHIKEIVTNFEKTNGLINDTNFGAIGRYLAPLFSSHQEMKKMYKEANKEGKDWSVIAQIIGDHDFELGDDAKAQIPLIIEDILKNEKLGITDFGLEALNKSDLKKTLREEIVKRLFSQGLGVDHMQTPYLDRNPRLKKGFGSARSKSEGTLNWSGIFTNKPFFRFGRIHTANPVVDLLRKASPIRGTQLEEQTRGTIKLYLNAPNYEKVKEPHFEKSLQALKLHALDLKLEESEQDFINTFGKYSKALFDFKHNPNNVVTLPNGKQELLPLSKEIKLLEKELRDLTPSDWGKLPARITPDSLKKYFKQVRGSESGNNVLEVFLDNRYQWKANKDGTWDVFVMEYGDDGEFVPGGRNITEGLRERGFEFQPNQYATMEVYNRKFGELHAFSNNLEADRFERNHMKNYKDYKKKYNDIVKQPNQKLRNSLKDNIKKELKETIIKEYIKKEKNDIKYWTTFRGRSLGTILNLYTREGILSKEDFQYILGDTLYQELGGDGIPALRLDNFSPHNNMEEEIGSPASVVIPRTDLPRGDYKLPKVGEESKKTYKGITTKSIRKEKMDKLLDVINKRIKSLEADYKE